MADLDTLRDRIRAFGAVFVDPWVAVDGDGAIIDFNPHFRGLFSRGVARKLQGGSFSTFVGLDIDDGGDVVARCLTDGRPARYDEVPVTLGEATEPRSFIVSTAPVEEGDTRIALVLLRDVSDAAAVQRKYKAMLERETKEKEHLQEEIARKTKELVDTNIELNRIQKELMRFKKGLFG